MPWFLSKGSTQQYLERLFSHFSIPVSDPGFCDHPNFLVREARDSRFLEHYARYVEARTYDEDYLAIAGRKIRATAEAVRAAVEADGRLGACVDASDMLGRMLDRLGVWNYVAKATLTITFPAESRLTPRYFWAIDKGAFAAPHAIVVAPPFGIVDVTVRHQPYDAEQVSYMPSVVLSDNFVLTDWHPDDLACDELRVSLDQHGISFDKHLKQVYPAMRKVVTVLPPRATAHNGTGLKYVVVAIGGAIEPLEVITGYRPCGRTALQIFEQDVLPQFS
jgi:hypothetical protein